MQSTSKQFYLAKRHYHQVNRLRITVFYNRKSGLFSPDNTTKN